jgi:hypothetical protein
MSSAGGDRGDEGTRNADHLKCQFLIVILKHYIENISRMEEIVVAKWKNGKGEWDDTENSHEIEAGPSERFQQGYK